MDDNYHDFDELGFNSDGAEGLRARTSKHWAKEEMPRDDAILLQSLPSKQFGKIIYLKGDTIPTA